ncbi:MAG TPA: GNAT family N-acetyltransferase [Micromonosporaceae bacterium]|jgi:RimJ/RimL family protein N-acetyltransferase
MHVFLTTDRLILRRLEPSDVDRFVELDADPGVLAFISSGPPTTRAEIEAMMPGLLAEYAASGGLGRFAALERSTGEFIGWMAMRPRAADVGELGYRLRPRFWGKGYATEGSRALLDAAFHDFPVQRVYAETMFINAPSRAVMERVGMRHLRTFHVDFEDPIPGTELGEVEYEITRAQWEQAR